MNNLQRQLMLKNLKSIPKLIIEGKEIETNLGIISVSELRNVKGFGEATVTKLVEKKITTIQQLKKAIEDCGEDKVKVQQFLTPPQLKQFLTHLAENPLLIEDV